MLMDINKLFETLNAGDLQAAKKELLLYGKIVKDQEWEDDKGFFRAYQIAHFSRRFYISMHNGTVQGISVGGILYLSGTE